MRVKFNFLNFTRFILAITAFRLDFASPTQIAGQQRLNPNVKGQHRYPNPQHSGQGK